MGRPRKFDHEAARRQFASGRYSVTELARLHGVSWPTMKSAVDQDFRAKREAYVRSRYAATCELCGDDCLAADHPAKNSADGRTLCARCRAVERRESVRFDSAGVLVAVRCSMTDCANGERWQPPENFTRGIRYPDLRNGGFHKHCRVCATVMRREYRHSHPTTRERENQKRMERHYAQKQAAA